MHTIKIVEIFPSPKHAGQMVTPAAHICRDPYGVWHSVVRWDDASDRTSSTRHTTHTTQEEADAAISKEIVQDCDRTRRLDSPAKLNAAIKLCHKYRLNHSVQFDPLTCELTVNGVVATSVVDALIGQHQDVEIGRDIDGEWEVNRKKTAEFQDALRRL